MAVTKTPQPAASFQCVSPGCEERNQAQIEQKYEAERNKQLQTRGKIPDADLTTSSRFKSFAKDPWAQRSSTRKYQPHQQHKVLIIGAGYGGLLFAVRLIQTGAFTAEDILIVDTAGGFGGTWYWNRYPGLMCDVESYIYMPLLEETGYMPRDKYASGDELRAHAERIAHSWKLSDRVLFRVTIRSLDWDNLEKRWKGTGVMLNGEKDQDEQSQTPDLELSADFVMMATGVFSSPKFPDFPNIMDYRGRMFHSSRWDYDCTGGSPENPDMYKLRDKKVGIIGTGATAIQAMPQLAESSEQLLVFQRTPSAVHERNNQQTDKSWWTEMIQSSKPGWQKRRMENFNSFTSHEQPRPAIDLVADCWTSMPAFSVIGGSQDSRTPDYLDRMKQLDLPRQEHVRARVRETVQNAQVAEALAPWYPGWCKRPCFHDHYLATFNRPNVRLLDVRKNGIGHFTPKGVMVDGTEHEVEVFILGTGYTTGLSSPGARSNIAITGRDGLVLEHKWYNDLATHHGVMTRDFPNMFFPGPSQAGLCVNYMYVLDQLATHVAYIVSTASKSPRIASTGKSPRVVIEPTREAEKDWTTQVLARVATHNALSHCTPGYYNQDGMASKRKDLLPAEKMKLARMAPWGEGIASYIKQIEDWRRQGELNGLELHRIE